ncbi:MAG: beta galactosidase jelly roll domain-containing protein [Prevotellaceae bacterium]|nr:beta galactosidase jelly roll domain-containing protein [Candidatus Minthosoma caballi]
MNKKIIAFFVIAMVQCVLGSVMAQTALRLPRFFSDGMVMQRGKSVPVWGWGEPGKTVVVNLNGKNARGVVGADGTWKVYLPKMAAGGPYNMSVDYAVAGQNAAVATMDLKETTVTVQNILIGDVFLCSGQSNMELPIRRCMDVVADDVKDYNNDKIRYLKFPHQYNYVRPNDDVKINPWQNITASNCAEVSGICYFMARELQEKTGVPIGIINSAVGGTQVQAWMPNEVLRAFDGYEQELSKQKYHQEDWPDSVSREENKAAFEWERSMIAADTIVGKWNKEGYDFSSWKAVDIFSDWSKGKNGSYWFRRMVNVPSELAGKAGVIRVGAMKDADSVWVNGEFVGNTTYEYPPRVYKIPAGVLKEGKNEVMVHLMSQSGRPNFTQGKLYQIEVGERTIPLLQSEEGEQDGEQWVMAQGCEMPRKPSSTYFVDCPTGLYNAMIAPLKDFPIKAMIWYQGESNVSNTGTYAALLEAMVGGWRKQFKSDFPVCIVQLAGYMSRHDKPFESGWTQIRNQQYMAAQSIKNAGLVSIFDTGEWNDIHPQDKKTAGSRSALLMRKLAYGEKKLDAEAPMPVKAWKKNGSVYVQFDKPVVVAEGAKYQVNGKILQLTAEEQKTVTFNEKNGKLRYAWDDYPVCVLYGANGVPVPQFEIAIK